MGLVGSSSLSTASSSACFSLSFFFFFFLTGSPSSKAVPSVPQKGQNVRQVVKLLRLQKEKLWDVRGCNDSYLPSALPLPAELPPAIIKIYNYLRHKSWRSDSTVHISWWILITLFLYAAPRVQNKLACFHLFAILLSSTPSKRTLNPPLETHLASSSLFTTDFSILMLEICQ